MRGLPGSGKSFTAKQLVGDGQIFSADDYWCLEDPDKYQFDKTKLRQAHQWNHRRVYRAVESELPVIVVDNTNTTLKELRSFHDILLDAGTKGYTIELVEPQTDWAFDVDECFKRNTHNVPKEVIQQMSDRYVKVIIEDILNPNI